MIAPLVILQLTDLHFRAEPDQFHVSVGHVAIRFFAQHMCGAVCLVSTKSLKRTFDSLMCYNSFLFNVE